MKPLSDNMIDWIIEHQIEQQEIWLEEQAENYYLSIIEEDDDAN